MALTLGIIGGGAAGFFAAIAAAEEDPAARVVLFERGKSVLEKVRISGGGRCNVTHACFDARELVRFYPRGSRELLAPFLRFGPSETIAWFERRGVRLKTEADGRMFPVTDDSATIVQCLTEAARRAGVTVLTGARVDGMEGVGERWRLKGTQSGIPVDFDRILISSGSSTAVWDMLAGLGHSIVPPVPSLFTFNTKDTRLRDLAGVSVAEAMVSVEIDSPGKARRVALNKLTAAGPLLVTHWGLSGPAILRLSAWGARELHACGYNFDLKINFLGDTDQAELTATLLRFKTELAKKQVAANPQFGLSLRLWQSLVTAAGIPETLRWADVGKGNIQALAVQLGAAIFPIRGKSTFKEEFVTAGGVDLKEINFKTFESKLLPGIFLAGEVLDIDAITGGFNFQAAWTGGWIAGQAMAKLSES